MTVNPVMSQTSVHHAAADTSPAAPEKVQKTQPQTEPQPGAGTDENRRSEIEQRLQTVKSELQAKDNDTYRKQNAQYTY